MSDKILTESLISIAKLDLAGYTTTIGNSEVVVTDRDGDVIARAPLRKADLYEFDIRQLFNQVEACLLGSAHLHDTMSLVPGICDWGIATILICQMP